MIDVPVNEITHSIIAAAIEVHRMLGPGLLESAYEECLCRELTLRKIAFETAASASGRIQGHSAGLRLSS